MKNFISNKIIIFIFIFLLSFLEVVISIQNKEFEIIGIDKSTPLGSYEDLTEEMCFSFSVKLSDEEKQLKDLYIRISIDSNDVTDMNRQQLFYSTKKPCPDPSEAELYSLRASKHPNIFAKYDNNIENFYLRVKCFNYPCKYSIYAGIENNYLFSTYSTIDDKETYSYYSYGDKINTMNFKIPSSLEKNYPNNAKHVLTISVSNPSDSDYIQLYQMIEGEKKEMEPDSYKTPTGIIFTFIEENYIDKKEFKIENCFYVLEIQSLENQFISISAKTSTYIENILESQIMPNAQLYYSYLNTKNITAKEECYKINEDYANANLFKNNDDLVFASIHYYTLPIRPYLKYNNEYKLLEEWDQNKNSVNIILKKESDIVPQICFKNEDDTSSSFSVEISYISKNNKNIDIYSPLTSGYIHMKTLQKNSLAFYTHNSDIHYNKKLSYFLKILKGKPEMYIMLCDDYPNCYNDISQLKGDDNVIKPNLKDNIIYTYSNYTNGEKDLSPYGPRQKLLYVFCPDDTTEEYCQFEILINSNLDQIILSPKYSFFSHLLKNESDLFKIHIPKNSKDFSKLQISINSQQKMELVFVEDNMNSTFNIKKEGEIYEFTPSKNYSIYNQDYIVLFNVKANYDSDYFIEYKTIKKGAKIFVFGKIEKINITYYPFDFCYKLPIKKDDYKNLLFNLNLKSLQDQNSEKTSLFNNIYINSTIININKFNDIESEENIDTSIFNEKPLLLNQEVDLSTKSILLNINKEYLNTLSNRISNEEELVLYFVINNNNKTKIEGKLFLIYENSTDVIIPSNNYISSKLPTNKTNFNVYRLQLGENKTKFVVDFSSNYELGNNFKISFIDYSYDIKQENIIKNSSNVNFTTSNNKNYAINQFEFTLNDNQKDILLCIYSNVEDKKLSSINYIFKYNTYDDSEYKNRTKFEINKKIQRFYLSDNDKRMILVIDNIKKIKDNKSEYCKGEIYLRKIEKNNKIDNEKIDCIALIESKYKLIEGKVEYEKNDEKIKIEMEYNNEMNYKFYSVFTDLSEENEKFSYNMIEFSINKKKRLLWSTIGIVSIFILIIILAIIILILCLMKKKKNKLEEDVNTVSFKVDDSQDLLGRDDNKDHFIN